MRLMSSSLISTLSGFRAIQITQVRPLESCTGFYLPHRYCSTDHKNHKDHSHTAGLQSKEWPVGESH